MCTNISIAKSDDLDELIRLLTALFTQDLEFTPDYQKQKNGIEMILNNHQIGEILVLKSDDKIIGMVSLLYSLCKKAPNIALLSFLKQSFTLCKLLGFKNFESLVFDALLQRLKKR